MQGKPEHKVTTRPVTMLTLANKPRGWQANECPNCIKAVLDTSATEGRGFCPNCGWLVIWSRLHAMDPFTTGTWIDLEELQLQ